MFIVPNNGIAELSTKSNNTANTMEVESDGTFLLKGDATVWDDLRVPLYARTGGSAPAFTSGFAGNSTLWTWNFAHNATNNMYFEAQLPHSWKGTTIYPHVHFAPTTTGTGSVRFILEYAWANVNSVYGASSTYNMDYSITEASQWKNVIAGGSGITPTTSQNGISSLLVGRLYRVGGGTGDTYAASAALIAIDIHYEIDTMGSREILTK